MIRLTSKQIPQGGGLDKVVALLRHLAGGGTPKTCPKFRQKRDRDYHVDAARVLGLMDSSNHLTTRGRAAAAEPDGQYVAIADALTCSAVGAAWLRWADRTDLHDVNPGTAASFLSAHSALSAETIKRRAGTLASWLTKIKQSRQQATGTVQLSFEERLAAPPTLWPVPARFPHNEDGMRVETVVFDDLNRATNVLLVTGYAALGQVVRFLAGRDPAAPGDIRLLFGNEPYPARDDAPHTKLLEQEMREYWLSHGISIVLSGAVLRAIEILEQPSIHARIARRRKMVHAKVYVTADAVVLGSSNFTDRGLGIEPQSEANVRFERSSEPDRHREAVAFGEALWTLGVEFKGQLITLLAAMVHAATWQEALARACAGVLEGDWARRYLAPAEFADAPRPPWPHQIQGISQALWILENVGSVLVADAPGSGKTTLGAWLLRAAYDRLVRTGGVRTTAPVVIAPPIVKDTWEDALREAHLPWLVHSHGYLSNTIGKGHRGLIKALADADLLAVDEAHNYLNIASGRTKQVLTHYAEHTILFTATPINRSASDLLAIIELLGADHLPDDALQRFAQLGRLHRGELDRPDSTLLDGIRRDLQRFVVRRTRTHLNEIVTARPDAYNLGAGRVARYPRITNSKFEFPASSADAEIATQIRELADTLLGVGRLPATLEIPFLLRVFEGCDDERYIHRVVACGKALARHMVLNSLRSSRAALIEHIHGTAHAWALFVPGTPQPKKQETGDVLGRLHERRGLCPEWKLGPDHEHAPRWLWDPDEHAAACDQDQATYRRIAELGTKLSPLREDAKAQLLARLAKERVVIAFDGHVITLQLLAEDLRARAVPVEVFTGEQGAAGKERAKRKLGRDTHIKHFVALCSDILSEGTNLQGASAVVHLDTPTVIRLAEQRAGRVDRMDTAHDEVEVWWPNEPPEFAPRKRDLLRERHLLVGGLIGSNLTLPDSEDAAIVPTDELVAAVEAHAKAETEMVFDAFQPVRDLIGNGRLVPTATYEQVRDVQARVVSHISIVAASTPWCFMALGGIDRRAPRWLLFPSLEAAPVTDFTEVGAALRARLTHDTPSQPFDRHADDFVRQFIERVLAFEGALLPPRRRRALDLLKRLVDAYRNDVRVNSRKAALDEIAAAVSADPRLPHPDPRSVADAWLRFLGTRIRRAFQARRRRARKPWQLEDLWDDLRDAPLDVDALAQAISGVPTLPPADRRVVALIVGVPGRA